MEVWITKYALTTGIYTAEGIEVKPHMIEVKKNRFREFFHGDDWHDNYNSAVQKAEKMRKARIASLRKQLDKLEKLTFPA